MKAKSSIHPTIILSRAACVYFLAWPPLFAIGLFAWMLAAMTLDLFVISAAVIFTFIFLLSAVLVCRRVSKNCGASAWKCFWYGTTWSIGWYSLATWLIALIIGVAALVKKVATSIKGKTE